MTSANTLANGRQLPKRFLLMVYGPMCAGKTTLINKLFESYDGIFKGSNDYIKWLISNCGLNKYKILNNTMTLKLTEVALEHGLSAMIDGNSHILAEMSSDYKSLAERYSVPIYEVNIEAPYNVLLMRFNERVKKGIIEATGTRPTIVTEYEMKRRYELYCKNKKTLIPTFSSEFHSSEEISRQIINSLFEHDAMKQLETETRGGRT